MPTRCIAAGCSKTTKDGVSLHLFPADPKYRRLWAAKVRLTRAKWSGPTSFSALCSEHFEPSCFESGIHHSFDMTRRAILKHDAVPKFFPASGKSKKVSERRDEPRGAFAKREQIRVSLNFEGMFLAFAKWHDFVLVPQAIHRACRFYVTVRTAVILVRAVCSVAVFL